MRSDIVALAKQSAAGTENSTPAVYIPVTTADMTTDATNLTLDETIGNRFGLDPDPGSRTYDVAMAGAVHPNSFGRVLSGFMGGSTMTTPGGGSTSRQHVFDPVATPTVIWHTMTLARVDPTPDIVDTPWDALGDTLTISVAPNEYMLYDAAWVARKLDDAQTTPTPTIDSSAKFKFSDVVVYFSIDGGSEAAVSCESVSLTLSNNIDRDFVVLGSAEVYALAQGNADVSGNFVIREAMATHYRNSLVIDGTKKYKIRVLATGGIIEGSIHYVVEFIVERATLTPASVPLSASDVLKGLSIDFTGAFSTATSKALTARIVSTVTTAL